MPSPREIVLLPGETTEEEAILRRIKQHEYMMSGGIPAGRDAHNNVTYTGPIDAADYPECPWHEDADCIAWNRIREGRGYWTKIQAEFDALSSTWLIDGGHMPERLRELQDQLALRPRDMRQLRERTDGQVAFDAARAKAKANPRAEFEAARRAAVAAVKAPHAPHAALYRTDGTVDPTTVLCAKHKGQATRIAAEAEAANDGTDASTWRKVPRARYNCVICPTPVAPKGNPWDRGPAMTEPIESTPWMSQSAPDYKPFTGSQYRSPKPEPVIDSRDDAISAFAGESVPDTIEIDGDEGEEQ